MHLTGLFDIWKREFDREERVDYLKGKIKVGCGENVVLK